MLVGWARDCCYRTRGIVRDVLFTGTGKNHTILEWEGSRYPNFCAPRLGAHVERVFSTVSAELCCVVVVLSPKAPCDGYLLHVVLPLHRFPACSPDRSRTGSSAQWDF